MIRLNMHVNSLSDKAFVYLFFISWNMLAAVG